MACNLCVIYCLRFTTLFETDLISTLYHQLSNIMSSNMVVDKAPCGLPFLTGECCTVSCSTRRIPGCGSLQPKLRWMSSIDGRSDGKSNEYAESGSVRKEKHAHRLCCR